LPHLKYWEAIDVVNRELKDTNTLIGIDVKGILETMGQNGEIFSNKI
jgi:hypothetical protein